MKVESLLGLQLDEAKRLLGDEFPVIIAVTGLEATETTARVVRVQERADGVLLTVAYPPILPTDSGG